MGEQNISDEPRRCTAALIAASQPPRSWSHSSNERMFVCADHKERAIVESGTGPSSWAPGSS